MKKTLIILAVLVASATSTFAMNSGETEAFLQLNEKKVFNGLMKYLGTNSEQADYLKTVFESTEKKIKNAERRSDEKAYDNAVVFNLANAKYVLSHEQYRKYLITLNLSMSNNQNLSANEN